MNSGVESNELAEILQKRASKMENLQDRVEDLDASKTRLKDDVSKIKNALGLEAMGDK